MTSEDTNEWKDHIVEEIRTVRDAHARKFNYDLWAIFDDLKSKQRKWEERGFEFVACPPKHVQKTGTGD